VHEEPEPLARYKKGVSAGLQALVGKCLAKDPAERYQSASDLLADLRRERRLSQSAPTVAQPASRERRSRTTVAIAAVGVLALASAVTYVMFPGLFGRSHPEAQAKTPRIAVLPFQNIGSAEDEYFADGITEEIIARLAAVRGVDVIARTSVMQYKGTTKSIPDIARELGVDYVLEGTIRWQKSTGGSGRVRITPQLVQSSDGTHVWANIYEDEITAVFAVQSDVSQKVVSALNVTLLEPERKRIASTQTENIEAYNFYLKGNEYWRQISAGTDEPNLRLASHLYGQSVGADSGYADAWARLGRSFVELYWHHQFNDSDLARAQSYVDRALALDPQSPEVRIAIGSLHYHNGEYEKALSEFNEARRLLPNDADLVMEIAYVLRRQGKPEALDEMRRAVSLDPLAANYHLQLARTSLLFHQYEAVFPSLDQAIRLTPDYADAYATKVRCLVALRGDTSAALSLLADAERVVQPAPSLYYEKGYIYGLTGRYEEAVRAMEVGRLLAFPESEHFNRAFYYQLAGDRNRALQIYDSALHRLETELDKNIDRSGPYAIYAMVLASIDRHDEARSAARKSIESNRNAQSMAQCRYALAVTHMARGQMDSAVTELESMLRGPCEDTYHILRLDPLLAPLRGHPRFQQLVAGELATPPL
jgi:TolB-like protein/tetratricopeptide (TPR) repeat protein